MPRVDLVDKYVAVTDLTEARDRWVSDHSTFTTKCIHAKCKFEVCTHGARLTEIHLITGTLLSVWSHLIRVGLVSNRLHEHNRSGREAKIVRTQLNDGTRIVGLQVPSTKISKLLETIVENPPSAIADGVGVPHPLSTPLSAPPPAAAALAAGPRPAVAPLQFSPALMSPALMSPALMSPALMSPALMSPALMSPALTGPGLPSLDEPFGQPPTLDDDFGAPPTLGGDFELPSLDADFGAPPMLDGPANADLGAASSAANTPTVREYAPGEAELIMSGVWESVKPSHPMVEFCIADSTDEPDLDLLSDEDDDDDDGTRTPSARASSSRKGTGSRKSAKKPVKKHQSAQRSSKALLGEADEDAWMDEDAWSDFETAEQAEAQLNMMDDDDEPEPQADDDEDDDEDDYAAAGGGGFMDDDMDDLDDFDEELAAKAGSKRPAPDRGAVDAKRVRFT